MTVIKKEIQTLFEVIRTFDFSQMKDKVFYKLKVLEYSPRRD